MTGPRPVPPRPDLKERLRRRRPAGAAGMSLPRPDKRGRLSPENRYSIQFQRRPPSGGHLMSESDTQEPADDELHIHLNLAGLAALMGTIEAAMARGRAELRLGWSGVSV